MMRVKIQEALPDERLRVTLKSGKVLEVGVSDYLTAPGYETLRKPAIFARGEPEEWGDGVVWPGDIGIPMVTLYRLTQAAVLLTFQSAPSRIWLGDPVFPIRLPVLPRFNPRPAGFGWAT